MGLLSVPSSQGVDMEKSEVTLEAAVVVEPVRHRRKWPLRVALASSVVLSVVVALGVVSLVELRRDVSRVDASGTTAVITFEGPEIRGEGSIRPAARRSRWGHETRVRGVRCDATLDGVALATLRVDAPHGGYPLSSFDDVDRVFLRGRVSDVNFDAAWTLVSDDAVETLVADCDADVDAGLWWDWVKVTHTHHQTFRLNFRHDDDNGQGAESSGAEEAARLVSPEKARAFLEKLRSSVSLQYAPPSLSRPSGELELKVDLGQWQYDAALPNKIVDELRIDLPRVAYDVYGGDDDRKKLGTVGLVEKSYVLFGGSNDLEVATFADPVAAAAFQHHVDDRRWELAAVEANSFFGLLLGERHYAVVVVREAAAMPRGRRRALLGEASSWCFESMSCVEVNVDDRWSLEACAGDQSGLCGSIDVGDLYVEGHASVDDHAIDMRLLGSSGGNSIGVRVDGDFDDSQEDLWRASFQVRDQDYKSLFLVEGSLWDQDEPYKYLVTMEMSDGDSDLLVSLRDDVFFKAEEGVFALVNDLRYRTSFVSSAWDDRIYGTFVLDYDLYPSSLTALASLVRNDDEKWLEVAAGITNDADMTLARLASYPHTTDVDEVITKDLDDDPKAAFFYVGHSVDLPGWFVPGWSLAFKGTSAEARTGSEWWANRAKGSYYLSTTSEATVTGTYEFDASDADHLVLAFAGEAEATGKFVTVTAEARNATLKGDVVRIPDGRVTYASHSRSERREWAVAADGDFGAGDFALWVDDVANLTLSTTTKDAGGDAGSLSITFLLEQGDTDDWYIFSGTYDVGDSASVSGSAALAKNEKHQFSTDLAVDLADLQAVSVHRAALYVSESNRKVMDVSGSVRTSDGLRAEVTDLVTSREYLALYLDVPTLEMTATESREAVVITHVVVDGDAWIDARTEWDVRWGKSYGGTTRWYTSLRSRKYTDADLAWIVATAAGDFTRLGDGGDFLGLRWRSTLRTTRKNFVFPWSSSSSSGEPLGLDTADDILLGLGEPNDDDGGADYFVGLRWFGTSEDDVLSGTEEEEWGRTTRGALPLGFRNRLTIDLDVAAEDLSTELNDRYSVDLGSRVQFWNDPAWTAASQRVYGVATLDPIDDEETKAGDLRLFVEAYALGGTSHVTFECLGDQKIDDEVFVGKLDYVASENGGDWTRSGDLSLRVDWGIISDALKIEFLVNDDLNVTAISTTKTTAEKNNNNGTTTEQNVVFDSTTDASIQVGDHTTYVFTATGTALNEEGRTPGTFDGAWQVVDAATKGSSTIASWTAFATWFAQDLPSSLTLNTTLFIADEPKLHAAIEMDSPDDVSEPGATACLDADVAAVVDSSMMHQNMKVRSELAFENVDRMWDAPYATVVSDARVPAGNVLVEMDGLVDSDSESDFGAYDANACDVSMAASADIYGGDLDAIDPDLARSLRPPALLTSKFFRPPPPSDDDDDGSSNELEFNDDATSTSTSSTVQGSFVVNGLALADAEKHAEVFRQAVASASGIADAGSVAVEFAEASRRRRRRLLQASAVLVSYAIETTTGDADRLVEQLNAADLEAELAAAASYFGVASDFDGTFLSDISEAQVSAGSSSSDSKKKKKNSSTMLYIIIVVTCVAGLLNIGLIAYVVVYCHAKNQGPASEVELVQCKGSHVTAAQEKPML
mmetsp:Transcript_29860/g.96349  ORF Transcript_29860/g.96349 Transcript_29860/m.96349 type:complete len:1655 (-) Transcript_29860:170-5134(-)